jgi:acyl-CoA synthetase (AMP-forming)/AMP-acid ligase II
MEALVEPGLALTSRAPDSVVAWQRGRAVTMAELLGDAQRLRRRLPDTPVLVNACRDRYAFLVGFVACRLAGRACLLPGDRSGARAGILRETWPLAHALVDDPDATDGWPAVMVETLTGERADTASAALDETSTIALTSGTTGDPVAHTRTWGSQALQIDALAQRFDLAATATTSIVATVPFGHMYGFELTILMPLRANVAIGAGMPLFAEDIRQALEAVPAPRVLVTSPFHLRALAALAHNPPPLARIISATAPLGAALASRIEQRCATEVHEIYGCTEAGSVASRRTIDGARWQPVDGMRFAAADSAPDDAPRFVVEVPAHRAPIPLADVLALDGTGGFELLGRLGDLVKVGGKRGSLIELTAALLAIDGVIDGAIVMPAAARDDAEDDGPATPDRPVALVAAPGLSGADILKALRARVDAAFVPRRVILLDALPRDAVGKLVRAEIDAALAGRAADGDMVTVPLRFEPDHPSLAGHFPGRPVVPGVVLLDAIARQARASFGLGALDGLPQAKFRRPVLPGVDTSLTVRRLGATRVAYEIKLDGELVASGELGFRSATS